MCVFLCLLIALAYIFYKTLSIYHHYVGLHGIFDFSCKRLNKIHFLFLFSCGTDRRTDGWTVLRSVTRRGWT